MRRCGRIIIFAVLLGIPAMETLADAQSTPSCTPFSTGKSISHEYKLPPPGPGSMMMAFPPSPTPDGKGLIMMEPSGEASILDTESGAKKKICGDCAQVVPVPGSKSLARLHMNGTLDIPDPDNSGAKPQALMSDVSHVMARSNPVRFVVTKRDNSVWFIDAKSGKAEKILDGKPNGFTMVDAQGQHALEFDGPAHRWRDLKSGKQEVFKFDGWGHVALTPEGDRLIVPEKEKERVTIRHLKTGKLEVIKAPKDTGFVMVNSSGDSVLFQSNHGVATIRHLATGKEVKTNLFMGPFAWGQEYCHTTDLGKPPKEVRLLNLSTFQEKILRGIHAEGGCPQSLPGGKKAYRLSFEGGTPMEMEEDFVPGFGMALPTRGMIEILDLEETCADEKLRVQTIEEACLSQPETLGRKELEWLEGMVEQDLCTQPFDAKEWDKAAPAKAENPLPRRTVEKLLLRFQKPGGFEPSKHLSVMLAVLKSDLPKTRPELVHGALQGILHHSQSLYEQLLTRMPMQAPAPPSAQPMCRSAEEEKAVQKSAKDYLRGLEFRKKRTTFKHWSKLYPLRSVLAGLPKDEKEELIDQIAQSIADKAAADPAFKEVFASKLYTFASFAVAPLFGEPLKAKSDVSLIRAHGKLTPVIFGTEPIDGEAETLTKYGFYTKRGKTLGLDNNAKAGSVMQQGEIAWVQGGHPYRAKVKVTALEKKEIVSSKPSPDYQKLWADGQLSGLIVLGSNLGTDQKDVLKSYLDYYEKRGFVFEAEDQKLNDLPGFVEKQIKGGEADYLIKEAHSEGDDRHVMRLDQVGKLKIGVRVKDGKKEVVRIVVPDFTNFAAIKNIEAKQFAKWIQEREKSKKGQLIYMNTSCNSVIKAAREIEEAQSPLLVDIPTATNMSYFKNTQLNAGRILLSGIREGKTYAEIRKDFAVVPGYSSGFDDKFLLPDEEEYKSLILGHITVPVSIDLKVEDENGHEVIMSGH